MDRKTEFVSQITNFPPLSPETNENSVSVILSKFFKFSKSPTIVKNAETVKQNEMDGSGSAFTNNSSTTDSNSLDDNQQNKMETSHDSEETEGRSLHNVLRRFSNLVAIKSTGGKLADAEHTRYWMPDHVSRECYECGARFSAFRRRHHCRICGQIFCARCCSHRVPGQLYGCSGGLRVCTHCCRIVLGYLQSTGGTEMLSEDLKALNDNLKDRIPKEFDKLNESGFLQETIGGEEGMDNRNLLHHYGLQDVFNRILRSLPLQHQRYRLIRYASVWRGGDISNWLLEHRIVSTSTQAISTCQLFLNEGFLECVTEHSSFVDYALYRPLALIQNSNDSGMNVMIGSTSSFCLDLNVTDNSARVMRGQKKDTTDNISNNESDNPLALEGVVNEVSGPHCSLIEAAGSEHIRLLLVQSLVRAGLNLSWATVLLPLCQQAANMVALDITSSEWDIRRCVRVKRVAGGSVKECRTVPGVVFSKNLAHRGMATQITTPRLLLLKSSIGYQRVEGKLVSLEPVIMQEEEYLRQCCARIFSFEPDLLLVSGAVSGLAQEQLRERGLALALGVRTSVLKRVARATRADILGSIDAHVARTPPSLGTCKAFYLLNYENKTLMVLEGYPNDMKCCSIIIRGAPLEELGRVKKVINLVLLAAYNWRLESSLLGDMGATLPQSNNLLVFNDNSKDTTPELEDSVFVERAVNDWEKSDDNNLNKGNSNKLTSATCDPLTSDFGHKKTDLEKSKSCGITVEDFSDPLRAGLTGDDEVFMEDYSAVVQEGNSNLDTPGDRWKTGELLISLSPQVRVIAPYLESEAGRRCPLRSYYRAPLFPPTPLHNTPPHRKISLLNSVQTNLKTPHAFVSQALKQSAEESQVKASLAHFRACGGRLEFQSFKAKLPPISKENDSSMTSLKEVDKGPLDPLDPEQHQRMYLLYYSYSSKSNNAPDFCVNPWIVRMDMYGNNDIPLGTFLERHCFNQQVVCTSPACQVPLTHHVRKFVHGDGCITVTCNTVDSSTSRNTNQQRLVDDDGKSPVMWWSRCLVCQSGSVGGGGACVRPPSLALSLAKYLELRFHASRYIRAMGCQHSLSHQHSHFFAQDNTTACFKYSKINSWDICLPPATIATHLNTRSIREGLINQINDLSLKGHELFSSIENGDSEKDYTSFKQHMDQIQLNLTSTSVQEQTNSAGVVKWLWAISDALVIGEKLLQDAIEKWTTQPTASKGPFKMTQDIIDGKIESDENIPPDFNAVDCAADNRGISGNSSEVEHPGGEEEEDKSDKRGLRAIISQLLNSSQPAHQNGVVLCGGVIPLIVRGSEVSSLAAAALASKHYQLMLQTSTSCSSTEQDDKDNGTPNNKDKSEIDGKAKNARSTDHIDVQLQDGLSCRVYYAKQFLKLRAMLLCPLESNININNDFAMKPSSDNRERQDGDSQSGSIINEDAVSFGKDKEIEVTIFRQERIEKELLSSVESSPVLTMKRGAVQVKLEPLSSIEEGFIRSLSRCVPWAARGGKSGSTFCKTIDDRYILKEMSKLELQLFVDLAPHYFHHIQFCHQNKLPTLLGRIVGVYHVDGVGGVGGGVLVMENLWHGREELAQRFDLKGAQRNRLANQGAPDNVLLDENLLKLRWDCPLYIQSHSAGVLWAAVQRDTDFLASHHIMDYSLLVGLDKDRQELVLGIIDYIRTFTWDKKLEHIVKKGLGSGLPTIVSPEQYKARFCTAMKKYFLQSPNQWEDLHRGLVSEQEEVTNLLYCARSCARWVTSSHDKCKCNLYLFVAPKKLSFAVESDNEVILWRFLTAFQYQNE